MSRKWERMVNKNKKSVNKIRVKQGKTAINEAGKEPMQQFLGRSWFLPLLFVGGSLFFMISYGFNQQKQDPMFWYTVFAYFLLGLFIFFVRRPSLRIGKTKLSSRRFNGNKTMEANEIEGIVISSGSAVVVFKQKKARWVFSRQMQLFKIEDMVDALKQFAEQNGIIWKNNMN